MCIQKRQIDLTIDWSNVSFLSNHHWLVKRFPVSNVSFHAVSDWLNVFLFGNVSFEAVIDWLKKKRFIQSHAIGETKNAFLFEMF